MTFVKARAVLPRSLRTLLLRGVGTAVSTLSYIKSVWPPMRSTIAGAAPAAHVKHIVYPGAFHELFNDPARAQAVPDLVGWMNGLTAKGAARG